MGTSPTRVLELEDKIRLRQLSFHAPEELHNSAELSGALDERLEMALDESERLRVRADSLFRDQKSPTPVREDELIELARAKSADLAGVVEYHDARYHRHMWALVIGVGMTKERVAAAPGPAFRDYSGLKDLHAIERANQIVYALLAKGIAAVPAVPWGLHTFEMDLVRLGEEAGLGRIGLNHCLLVPGFGPRVKLAAVYMRPGEGALRKKKPSLPDVCRACRLCVPACPAEALQRDDPHRCRLHFRRNHACGVCLQVCPL
ncbi:MAG: hypothetical protein HYR85_20730 [Planctomycetes bacterium]|nr:hypothetical protein [Planctomycetota bacterium]MBI3846125.1 hypothetical protein [Planctomycetota bacterium]